MWLSCQSWSSPEKKVLPWDGGWLDWDLGDSKSYLWLEELVDEIRSEMDFAAQMRERAQEAAKGFYGNAGNG